jgi:hypothetical protein
VIHAWYTLYSGGLVVLMRRLLRGDGWKGRTRWAFLLLVIGANSIAITP